MPVSIPIPAFLSCLLLVGSAYAQVSAPNCTDNNFDWASNSLQQNPCWVMAYLAATCNDGTFFVPVLTTGLSYTGPTSADKGDVCKCNTVVYNLVSACDACQGEAWTPYSTWKFNCTAVANPGTFPNPVPIGTRVPKWAYLDTSIGDNWNYSAAQAAGDSPEVTGSVSSVPTSTFGVSQSTLTPSASGSGPSSTSTSHSSNSGAIAGGAVGAFLGVALVAGVVAWFIVRRRRRARSAPSAEYMSGQWAEMGQQAPYPMTQRLYDPSDPTTFPSNMFLPASEEHSSSTSHPQPHDGGYSGLPEI